MSTSANVIEYRIEKNHELVSYFRKHLLCKMPEYSELLQYQPLSEYTITATGYDEEEDYWENDSINLEEFMRRMIRSDKKIREYFEK